MSHISVTKQNKNKISNMRAQKHMSTLPVIRGFNSECGITFAN